MKIEFKKLVIIVLILILVICAITYVILRKNKNKETQNLDDLNLENVVEVGYGEKIQNAVDLLKSNDVILTDGEVIQNTVLNKKGYKFKFSDDTVEIYELNKSDNEKIKKIAEKNGLTSMNVKNGINTANIDVIKCDDVIFVNWTSELLEKNIIETIKNN